MSKLLDILQKNSHVPIALGIFATVSTYHFWTGHDLGSNYVSCVWACFSFLGAHAGTQIIGNCFGKKDQ